MISWWVKSSDSIKHYKPFGVNNWRSKALQQIVKRIDNGEVFTIDNSGRTVQVKRSDYFGLPNRSRHNANLKLFYNWPKIGIKSNLRLLYRSKYGLFDTNGNGILDQYDSSFVDGFITANMAITKTLGQQFDLQIGANNLFNYTDRNIPNLNGLQLYTRLNFNF